MFFIDLSETHTTTPGYIYQNHGLGIDKTLRQHLVLLKGCYRRLHSMTFAITRQRIFLY